MGEEAERARMVREQLEAREVSDERVLEAMRRVPRHLFVPEHIREHAYEDRPQPIGEAQTISQPLMVGLMTELLRLTGSERVLEIGTGSGYQAAVLAELAAEVVSVERKDCLAARARELLQWLGYTNVRIEVGDGTEGWPELAPYDRIVVTAGAPMMPKPLTEQLAAGGRIVAPVGTRLIQTLIVGWKTAEGELVTMNHGECVFVPLIGRHGWPNDDPPGG